MTESETEAETLDRLESALRRIAEAAYQRKRPANGAVDREALVRTLDTAIGRLRAGLQPPHTAHHTPE